MKIRKDFRKKNLFMTAILFVIMMVLCLLSGTNVLIAAIATIICLGFKMFKVEIGPIANVIWVVMELVLSSILSEKLVQYLLLDAELRANISHNHTMLNIYCCLVLYLVLILITSRPQLSCFIGHIVLITLAGVDYFVYQFRQVEFTFSDLKALSTGLSVASNYKLTFDSKLVYVLIITIVYCVFVLRIHVKFERKWMLRFTALAGAIVLTSMIAVKAENITMESWEQKGTYRNGYILNFVLSVRDSFVSKPEDYSLDEITSLEEKYATTEETGSDDDPTIIVIMNESFADLGVIGNLSTSEEVTPFYDSLEENTIKGYALSSVFGAKTPNSEWEFLTGNSMAFLPSGSVAYQQYVSGDTYSLVSTLKERGYTCLAMHPYYASGWSRNTVYPLMGFDHTFFIDDFDQTKIMRDYITDQELYDKIIAQYEAKETNEKLFVMGITMQNHGGYTDAYDNFTSNIQMKNGYYSDVNQYLSLLNASDKALENLITYFKSVNDKVEIVFFGDHQPSLNSNFYRQLNGKGLSGLTLDELEDLFEVPFFIWTNYDSEEKEVPITSLNYLSTLALEQADIALPAYNSFLADLMDTIPAMNSRAFYSKSAGKYVHYEDATGDEADILDQYEMLQYNNIFDDKNTSEVFFPYYSED